jgi:signal transduction histidine kinase
MTLTTIPGSRPGSIAEITSIIHDLRNPLSTIQCCAEALLNARLPEPQAARIARNLHGASIRLKELFDEFLTQHRETEHRADLIDADELVAAVVRRLAVVAECQAVEIIQNVPEKLAIAGNQRRIERVIANLLTNALEMMPGGGTIRISAFRQYQSVVIKVRDNGPGIAPEIRSRLFEPFSTARKPGGLGLGLALSRQTVMDHGGEMWDEAVDDGACFAFRLPGAARGNLTPGPPAPTGARGCAARVELTAGIL